jgi:glycosyltransferase involved in cell wall biosynthesis
MDYWQTLASNSRVLPVSEALRTMLIEQEKIPPHKIELLLNAIPIPAPVDRPCRQNSATLSVLFVGRLTKQKNVICLVKAVELIKHLPISVTIVGEGIEKPQLLKQVATSSLNGRITFLSPNADIYQLFAKHDILVLPSLFEGLPMIILESFSAMLPVIGSDIPGNKELLSEDRGTLFPTDDCVTLAELLQQAYADYALFIKKAHMAYDYVRLHHNIDRYLENLVIMYSTSNLR